MKGAFARNVRKLLFTFWQYSDLSDYFTLFAFMLDLLGAGGALVALVIKRVATGVFGGHWSLLTTINGGLTGMVRIMLLKHQ